MRVSGLGEVVVYVHTGVLRLQDVVVRGGASEDGGNSDTESHTRCESVAGFAVSSDGSLSVSCWTFLLDKLIWTGADSSEDR